MRKSTFALTIVLSIGQLGAPSARADEPMIEIGSVDPASIELRADGTAVSPEIPDAVAVAVNVVHRRSGGVVIIRRDEGGRPNDVFVGGFGLNTLDVFYVSAGIMIMKKTELEYRNGFDYAQGMVFELAPGLHGTEVSVGWARLGAAQEDDAAPGTMMLGEFGYALRGTMTYTYGKPFSDIVVSRALYAGVEADVVFLFAKMGVGVVRKLTGAPGRNTLLTWTFGVGF